MLKHRLTKFTHALLATWCAVVSCRAVESISGIRPETQAAIAAAVDHCITQTSLPLPNKRVVSWHVWVLVIGACNRWLGLATGLYMYNQVQVANVVWVDI